MSESRILPSERWITNSPPPSGRRVTCRSFRTLMMSFLPPNCNRAIDVVENYTNVTSIEGIPTLRQRNLQCRFPVIAPTELRGRGFR